MTAPVLIHNIFIGIDVGGTSFEAAWHRGGVAHYENRPDAIAAFVSRLQMQRAIARIAIEPTGGYERPLVKALRRAGLPIAVADACTEVRQFAHYVTQAPGGRGAVREAIELILRCQGAWQRVIERLLAL